MADRRARAWRQVALVMLLTLTAGCVRGCKSRRTAIHINPNMDYQERVDSQSESDFFYDGSSMRMPVEGTVARGELPPDPARGQGRDADGGFLTVNALEITDELLQRGDERFGIYCAPCHANDGLGQGILTTRGSVPVPSFRDERLLTLPDGEFFDTITYGKGLMPAYAYPIQVDDRWAIIAHVRTLQGLDPAAVHEAPPTLVAEDAP